MITLALDVWAELVRASSLILRKNPADSRSPERRYIEVEPVTDLVPEN